MCLKLLQLSDFVKEAKK